MDEIKPSSLYFESFLAKRHAKFEDTMTNLKPLESLINDYQHIDNDIDDDDGEYKDEKKENNQIDNLMKEKNKIVFAEGYLFGVVPLKPDCLDVDLKSIKRERAETKKRK